MAELLKNMFFTRESMKTFTERFKEAYSGFSQDKFIKLFFDSGHEQRALKQLMRHTTECLKKTLPVSYEEALGILKKAAPDIKGFEAMAFPDFVEMYGMDNWDLSLPALAYFTRYASSEFAIRPFLDAEPQRTIAFMLELADDENENVRRFASEGCRSRLPWAMALPKFKKDPAPVLKILEKLKSDPSEFVRRSVANNLNDISKDNPEIMIKVCEEWYGKSLETDWIVKHACRSLLKSGDKRALILFGYKNPDDLFITELRVKEKKISIGDKLPFEFNLMVKGEKSAKVRMEYAIDFVKARGKRSRKVFKISENTFKPGEYPFARKHPFHDMTTRTHYPGDHTLTIIVNGEEKAEISVSLKK